MNELLNQTVEICNECDVEIKQFDEFCSQIEGALKEEEKLFRSTTQICEKQSEDLQSLISTLCEKVSTTQAQVNDDTVEKQHQQQFQQLHINKNSSEENINTMQQQTNQLQNQIQQVKEEILKIRNEKQNLQFSSKKQADDLKSMETLYTHITNVEWDFEAAEQGRIKGTMFLPNKQKPIQKFDFDHQNCTQAQIVNQIWQFMG
eukprot:TRINITY_DN895_c0_g2_i2.p1 TRINITY_DN895_c0_g2~~TRINITY_DN895_c0_g2_i2.p1  ORF type:complete len:204 (+),score=19.02 TRINITY_DN895_c0_g2_i2:315-926(+)